MELLGNQGEQAKLGAAQQPRQASCSGEKPRQGTLLGNQGKLPRQGKLPGEPLRQRSCPVIRGEPPEQRKLFGRQVGIINRLGGA